MTRVALVTGAGGGIGRASALALAKAGACLVVTDLAIAGIEETAHLIERAGGKAAAIAADISNVASVDQLFEKAINTFGHFDVALNNAGISQAGQLTADIDAEQWDRVLRTNLTGTWLCMRAELRHMVSRKSGAIVNTASVAGLRSIAGQSAYVSSKHAVVGLTKNAAMEYASHGIRINAVCPGGTLTPMVQASLDVVPKENRDQALAGFAGLHPMKRMGTSEEVADAVVFLLSDHAQFITGHCLSVDGGWNAQ